MTPNFPGKMSLVTRRLLQQKAFLYGLAVIPRAESDN
jgi:hypothetical protein